MVKTKPGCSFEWTSYGGNNENFIGANCHCYDFKHRDPDTGDKIIDRVIIDLGIGPGGVMPDIRDILPETDKILLTHFHHDHMEAILFYIMSPFFTSRGGLEMGYDLPPIFGTPYTIDKLKQYLTIEMARTLKSDIVLPEHKTDLRKRFEKTIHNLNRILPGNTIRIGKGMDITAIPISHSAPQSVAFEIGTSTINGVHTGDCNLDQTYLMPCKTNMDQLKKMGKKGVDFLMVDSTGADKNNPAPVEQDVRDNILEIIQQNPDKRAVLTVMGGHDQRLMSLIDIAKKTERDIFVAGHAMKQTFHLLKEMGRIPYGLNVHFINNASDQKKAKPGKSLVITTGAQGENGTPLRNAIHQMGGGLTLSPAKDMIIFSSSMLSMNRGDWGPMLDVLKKRRFQYFYHDNYSKPLNAPGHARAPEIKQMIDALRPSYGFPIHGMFRRGRKDNPKKGLIQLCATLFRRKRIPAFEIKNGQTVRLDHPDGPTIVRDNAKKHQWIIAKRGWYGDHNQYVFTQQKSAMAKKLEIKRSYNKTI